MKNLTAFLAMASAAELDVLHDTANRTTRDNFFVTLDKKIQNRPLRLVLSPSHEKIADIKAIRSLHGVGLKEAKDLRDSADTNGHSIFCGLVTEKQFEAIRAEHWRCAFRVEDVLNTPTGWDVR